MRRRDFLVSVAGALAAPMATAETAGPATVADVKELTLAGIAREFAARRLTSVQLTAAYLARIAAVDRSGPTLRAVLEVNPAALDAAAALDREWLATGPRSPLHGVPILIKDNIETADRTMTTAGSLALEGCYAAQDAELVARLRAAGAVILGKTNLSEWANFRSTHACSGWSGRGGQTLNPYALNRSPSGSSAGSAVAVSANLCALAVGTETNGSIVSPASVNGIVGFKPTVGLVSRSGVIPLSRTQDTAGPLTRTVRDAAVLLGVMSGRDYVRALDPQGLRGARLGIARRFFAGDARLDGYLDRCVATLARAGAVIVEGTELPPPLKGDPELTLLLYEFKTDLNRYLRALPAAAPVHSLAELIRFNEAHAATEMPRFDQELLRDAETKGSLQSVEYRTARRACVRAARDGIDRLLARHRLDAIVTLTSSPAAPIDAVNGDADSVGCSSPAAIAGYPHISVPAGLYRGLPVGLSLFTGAGGERTLLRLACGFEGAAAARPAPTFARDIS